MSDTFRFPIFFLCTLKSSSSKKASVILPPFSPSKVIASFSKTYDSITLLFVLLSFPRKVAKFFAMFDRIGSDTGSYFPLLIFNVDP